VVDILESGRWRREAMTFMRRSSGMLINKLGLLRIGNLLLIWFLKKKKKNLKENYDDRYF
jgi:hypothetical protein